MTDSRIQLQSNNNEDNRNHPTKDGGSCSTTMSRYSAGGQES